MNPSSEIEIISQRLEVEATAPHARGRKGWCFLIVRSLVKNYAPTPRLLPRMVIRASLNFCCVI